MSQRKSDRPVYGQRLFRLVDDTARQRCLAMIANAPLDKLRPLQVMVREEPRQRKQDQNALMFAGPLKDISEQVWLNDKQYSIDCWHAYFKQQCLPDVFDTELCLEGYQKFEESPSGQMLLVGSTTQLTVKGFSEYMEQIYSFGAAQGVQFTSKENI